MEHLGTTCKNPKKFGMTKVIGGGSGQRKTDGANPGSEPLIYAISFRGQATPVLLRNDCCKYFFGRFLGFGFFCGSSPLISILFCTYFFSIDI